ncbi:PAS domain S-box protein [Streptomyces phaeolivaceus]|uniref:PAS domain S-box protein n=1 Tax=Streptomyces phaeolivaceus TaxID=2653200 RepID=UPI001D04F86D|nr:PAS domain S-box protein [Streptomyces phaeolivaceus]
MDLRQGDAVVWRNRAMALFDRLPMPVAVCDVYGSVVLANPAMATEWGTAPGSLRGRDVLELFRPQEATRVERIAQALRLRHRSRYPVSVRWDAADGAHRVGELTADPISDGPVERDQDVVVAGGRDVVLAVGVDRADAPRGTGPGRRGGCLRLRRNHPGDYCPRSGVRWGGGTGTAQGCETYVVWVP